MPLRIELKPFERLVIGEAVLINSGTRTTFMIDGEAPILRESDCITPETANTPARRLYLCVQVMYLKNDISSLRDEYQRYLRLLRVRQPEERPAIDLIDAHVSGGMLYKALKEIRKITKRERVCLSEPALAAS